MYRVLVRHRVMDYINWKNVFDEDVPNREQNGIRGGTIFRNADDPEELFVLLELSDMRQARHFFNLDRLSAQMETGGVSEEPDIYFLEEVAEVEARPA